MKLLLDTNVLLRRPDILSRRAPGVQFAILPQVVEQLRYNNQSHQWLNDIIELINAAIMGGWAEIVELEELLPRSADSAGDDVDTLLLNVLKAYDERGSEALLVTDDGQLRHAARDFGYRASTSDQAFKLLLDKSAVSSPELREKAEVATRASRRYTWTSFVSGIVVAVLANSLYEHVDLVVRTINVWGTIAALPALGIAFYWIRSRFRLTYGVIEFLVGLLTSVRVFLPSFNYDRLSAVEMLQILGGLYVMVRGLENIGRGLRGTRLQLLWERVFSAG